MNLIAALVGHSQEFHLHMFSSTYSSVTWQVPATTYFFTLHYKKQYNTHEGSGDNREKYNWLISRKITARFYNKFRQFVTFLGSASSLPITLTSVVFTIPSISAVAVRQAQSTYDYKPTRSDDIISRQWQKAGHHHPILCPPR